MHRLSSSFSVQGVCCSDPNHYLFLYRTRSWKSNPQQEKIKMKTWRDINHNPFKLCYWHSHQRMLLVVCFFSYPAGKTCFDSESILLLPRVMFATNRALTFFPFSSYYLNTKQELSVPLYVLLLLMCLMSVLGFFLLSGIQADKYTRLVKKKGKAGWRRASWVIGARIIRITLFVWHFSKHTVTCFTVWIQVMG